MFIRLNVYLHHWSNSVCIKTIFTNTQRTFIERLIEQPFSLRVKIFEPNTLKRKRQDWLLDKTVYTSEELKNRL